MYPFGLVAEFKKSLDESFNVTPVVPVVEVPLVLIPGSGKLILSLGIILTALID